jgi:hypothetical protein
VTILCNPSEGPNFIGLAGSYLHSLNLFAEPTLFPHSSLLSISNPFQFIMAEASPAPRTRSQVVLRDPVAVFFLEIPFIQESPYVCALKIARRLWLYLDVMRFAFTFVSSRDNSCALLRVLVHFFIFMGHLLYYSGIGFSNSFHRRLLSDIPLSPGLQEREVAMFESMYFHVSQGDTSGVVGDADMSFIQSILDRDSAIKHKGQTGFVETRLE